MLISHLGDTDDFSSSLNHDQRIILASHRFAPEVTSAVLWLERKGTGRQFDNLRSVGSLYAVLEDGDTLYVQANTIIPTPGTEDYMIGIGRAAR